MQRHIKDLPASRPVKRRRRKSLEKSEGPGRSCPWDRRRARRRVAAIASASFAARHTLKFLVAQFLSEPGEFVMLFALGVVEHGIACAGANFDGFAVQPDEALPDQGLSTIFTAPSCFF
jgi:hypothetical protein